MRADLPDLLPIICPVCRRYEDQDLALWSLRLDEILETQPSPDSQQPQEVLQGILSCQNPACGQRYPIVDGIPVVVRDPAQLLTSQPASLHPALLPQVAALFVRGATDDAPFARLLEHLSIYLDAHWGDHATPVPGLPLLSAPESAGGAPLFAFVDRLAQTPVSIAVELGCGAGRMLHVLRRRAALSVGIDLHLPTLRIARRILAGEPQLYARRQQGRHYSPAALASPVPVGGLTALLCADALDPPLPPAVAGRVVACNLYDVVSTPAQIVSVLDGLCERPGELFFSSPYAFQSGVVHEDAWPTESDPAAAVRARFLSGRDLRSPYTLVAEDEVPWILRRDQRSAVCYRTHALALRTDDAAGASQ